MEFFTAVTHLGHTNIIKYCNRPFDDIEHHDQVIIDNINQKVKTNDELYIVGYFAFCGPPPNHNRDMINCKNVHLVIGSHDYRKGFNPRTVFDRVDKIMDVQICKNGKKYYIVLCHWPIRSWHKSHYGTWHLYGHVHGNLPDDITSRSFDVGVDVHNFFPLSFDEVEQIINQKKARPPLKKRRS